MRYNKDSEWYEGYEAELLKFTGASQAMADDQFDATAWLSRGFDNFGMVDVDNFKDEEEWDMERQSKLHYGGDNGGRSASTGY